MNSKITFATNTGPGTLEYTKLLLRSLKENLDNKEHEILVFIDSDNDGTLDYLKSIKKDFHDLKIVTHKVKPVVGPERNCNLIAELAKHDIVSYLQSDMVVSKHYDTNVLSSLEENTIMSSTRVEPPLHEQSDKTFTANFGLNPEEFNMRAFLEYSEKVKSNKSLDYFFAPYTFHKDTWNKMGGYDTVFRRSRCDSDLVQRCMQLGIKLKQTFSANVYHFTCVSSRGKNWFDSENKEAQNRVLMQNKADMVELRRFVRKWGSFNHGESILFKYDIDLFIHSEDDSLLSLAVNLEPYFSKVYLMNPNLLEKAKNTQQIDLEHEYANNLYGFSNEDWQASKKFYNKTDYNQIYKLTDSHNKYNACLYLHSTENLDYIYQNIQHLHKLIDEVEELGDYEFGSAVLSIKNKVLVQNDLCVKNPEFDMSLLTIE
jgi:GT2 family glycosyltransferase